MPGLERSQRPITTPSTFVRPIPAGRALFERHQDKKAAFRRKRSTLHRLRYQPEVAIMSDTSSDLTPLSPRSDQISLMGDSEPPPIPQQVLDSALHSFWSDPSLRTVCPMMDGPEYDELNNHNLLRDDIFELMRRLEPTDKPSIRIVSRHRPEADCVSRHFQPDPYDTSKRYPLFDGRVDYAMYWIQEGDRARPHNIVLVIEVKPGELSTQQVYAVDRQVRARANAAYDNGVNKHFYLIAWVGYSFRPYYWCQGDSQEHTVPADIDPSRRPGIMRPSDSDLVYSRTFNYPGPQLSLWRDIRDPDNQRLLQQIIKDATRACDGMGPEFPGMYGPPCETVSKMSKGESDSESPESGGSSGSFMTYPSSSASEE